MAMTSYLLDLMNERKKERQYPIGFKIIGAQAQNMSPNARLKKGLRSRHSTSAGLLMTSPKYRPKIRAQFTPSKGW